ncbi:hypothetical protein DY000_02006168 [Brassica cretica]|uniref:VAN3-binding protein-like auxin canalisation domain-containing protein n=1 Tax=Brassica cretica TaxID=69181 RepID=A0ABQ7BXS3_BRACR|nr:hypothetical protein DY000_02006168 [Brassica cretica]
MANPWIDRKLRTSVLKRADKCADRCLNSVALLVSNPCRRASKSNIYILSSSLASFYVASSLAEAMETEMEFSDVVQTSAKYKRNGLCGNSSIGSENGIERNMKSCLQALTQGSISGGSWPGTTDWHAASQAYSSTADRNADLGKLVRGERKLVQLTGKEGKSDIRSKVSSSFAIINGEKSSSNLPR